MASATFSSVTYQYFRLDLARVTATGVRIVEFDAIPAAPVPEPGQYALLIAGLVMVGTVARIRRQGVNTIVA